eukprot:2299728-Rhodomonas_salina.2
MQRRPPGGLHAVHARHDVVPCANNARPQKKYTAEVPAVKYALHEEHEEGEEGGEEGSSDAVTDSETH